MRTVEESQHHSCTCGKAFPLHEAKFIGYSVWTQRLAFFNCPHCDSTFSKPVTEALAPYIDQHFSK